MKTIYDLRGIGPKSCGVQMVALEYLKFILEKLSTDNDIFLFNSSVKDIVDNYNINQKHRFIFTNISRFNLIDGVYLLFKFGLRYKFVSFHSSLPIFYLSMHSKYFICHDLFVIDDTDFFNKYSFLKKKIAKFYFYTVLYFSLLSAKKIIVPSNYVRKSIEKRFAQFRGKIIVIHNPLGNNFYGESRSVANKSIKKRLLYIGNLRSYKGYEDLYNQFRKLDPLLFELIVITSDPSYKKIIGIPNVHVFYKVNDDVKFSFIENSDLLVIPSKFEGFGLPVLEGVNRECNILISTSSSFCHFDALKINKFDFLSNDSFVSSINQSLNEGVETKKYRKQIAMSIFNNNNTFNLFKNSIS
jgi:hypothetical protein